MDQSNTPPPQQPQETDSPNGNSGIADIFKFPYPDSQARLNRYQFNDNLFIGAHFDAYNLLVQSEHWNKAYAQLKYVTGNFAGLISKVCADMLFSEAINVRMDDDKAQAWMNGLIFQNKLHTQNYESALANSRHGDAVFKLRTGYLNPGDEDMTVIIEDITPAIYFPQLSNGNIRQEPERKELAWTVQLGGKKYLRKEIHYPGYILNELYLLEGQTIKQQVSVDLLGDPTLTDVVQTGISKSLIVHVPNWRDGSRYFGYDDYGDLLSLFYALNNRLTKTENILDKHSDPILALPEGVLDENGEVKRQAFNMFEIPSESSGTPAKPEYIVWNASLDSSFSQIDKLVQFMYMFSETSPDAFGMGDGKIDSGRALKLRLMRTIAKVSRKRLYYDSALKELLHTAQLLAQAQNLGVYDEIKDDYSLKLTTTPEIPEIEWQDGLPIDQREAAEIEQIRLASENTTIEDSIMRLDDVDEATAKEKADEIREQGSVSLPASNPKMGDMKGGDIASGDSMDMSKMDMMDGNTMSDMGKMSDMPKNEG